MEANEAMKAMARRVCARIVEGDSDNPLRVMKANRYLSGTLDDDHHMAIALAAILETQRLDAELADSSSMRQPCPALSMRDTARASRMAQATQLRSSPNASAPVNTMPLQESVMGDSSAELRAIAGSLRRGRWLTKGEEDRIDLAADELSALRELVAEICEAMECAAGCDEGVDEDTAASEIMLWAGSPMVVAYTKARAILAKQGGRDNG